MNPNLGSNSGMRIFESRILGPNSGVEFFGPVFSNKRSPLKNSPSRNSPPKIHIKKFTPEFGQRIAKGAGGKGPRQKTSKIVKKCQKVFRNFSTIFAQGKKKLKNRQKASKTFPTIFARHHAILLRSPWCLRGKKARPQKTGLGAPPPPPPESATPQACALPKTPVQDPGEELAGSEMLGLAPKVLFISFGVLCQGSSAGFLLCKPFRTAQNPLAEPRVT